ncbi:hypothetical protein [Bradyrhizobium japonicum]|uniref:hypothetical protein n=1 Tax=Bradyrhizobium japonicum TaxID=375 RepID=UPI001B8A8B99|nr:hypothetical protein [Bradyrhizobium japonicum]MBR0972308.1 hypothetical protein [Bradyrhizobium japonicum]
MTIFRLAPIDIRANDEKWAVSTIREAVWVEARDDIHARHLVENATLKMAEMHRKRKILYSPWLDPVITSCFPDKDAKHPPKGKLLTAEGETIEIPGAETD